MTRGFPHNTDDKLWEAMIEGDGREFCCKVARLEDRRCHLCYNDVAAKVRSAVSREKQALANCNVLPLSGH